MIVEPQGNQILLRGSDQAQKIVRQFLESVDRPPPRRPKLPPNRRRPAPVVRGYLVPRGQLREVAARLEARLRTRPEVRWTTDPDTSQVIVLALTFIQTIVASELNRPVEPGSASAAGLPAVLPARPAASSLQLTRVPLTRIELQLRQMRVPAWSLVPQGRNDGPDFVLVKGTWRWRCRSSGRRTRCICSATRRWSPKSRIS